MDNRQGDPIFAKSRAEQLEDWLANVFWFHYKWYFMAAVFAAALIIMFLVGAVSEVKYDWKVVYLSSAADSARDKELVRLLEDALPETGRNHRVDVELLHASDTGAGEPVYGYLENEECVIFLLDEAAKEKYTKLGFFEGAVPVAGREGLYAAMHDAPVKPLSAEDPQYSSYSQKFLDAVNRENLEEHDKLIGLAQTAISELSK